MEEQGRKPSLGWAILSLVLPVAVILYGTLVVGVRPPVLPLLAAVALAAIMAMKTGYRWEQLEKGMFDSLSRIWIAVAVLFMVGMIIAAWLASGTIPAIIYWGLKLIAPEHFLLSAMLLCSVASVATGTSFGTMGTIGVALLGVGQALGYPAYMTVGAIVSGAYLGDKMSPVSDSTNIAASVSEVSLFGHVMSMMWTTVPAFILAGIVYTVVGADFASGQNASLANLDAILKGLESHFSLGILAFVPPVLMIVLAYKRFPVLPVMLVCLVSAVIIALIEGVPFNNLAKMLTSGYVSKTGVAQLDPLLSRGGLMSIMPTVLLLCSGMAFGGILEKSRVLEVLLEYILRGARSAVRLVVSVLAAAYLINLGTGSQMLAVIDYFVDCMYVYG
ncbi:MAG: Na+/H+ antiporter NhaC family protein, partial [Desulfovibrionaceae bacterium]|nr:Na+/H+ antiporter NhaC family protein [Desulfovibrionaceae bacterium]